MLWLLVSLRLKPSEEANETMECASLPFVVARLRLALAEVVNAAIIGLEVADVTIDVECWLNSSLALDSLPE